MTDIFSILQNGSHYVIPFVIILSIVVFVHEFGHYWVARRCGVKIETFSIGFGREIWGRTDRFGTRWKISCLPLGGYVKMFGDADETSSRADESIKTMSDEDKALTFAYKSVGQRFAIVAAGPSSNYLFAIVVMALLFMFTGQPFTPPVVDTVMEGSAAAKAGLILKDKIVRVDGQAVDRFEDIKRLVALNSGSPMVIEIERDGKPMSLTATPEIVLMKDRLGGEHRLGRLGVTSQAVGYIKRGPLEALEQSVLETWNITTGTLKAVGQMMMGLRGAEELGGPLRIAEMSGKVASEGTSAMIWFLTVISINLGLINFFPIPLLDGGNLVFYIIEVLRRKPLSDTTQEVGSRIGVFLVMSLMVFATWNDLVHLRVISYISGLFS